MKSTTLRARLERAKGGKAQLQKKLSDEKDSLKRSELRSLLIDKSLAVVKEVALETQKTLQYNISDVVSSALGSIFPDPYNFRVEFVANRGKTECNLLFERGGNAIDPIESSGVGAIDIAAFALRVAAWSMSYPKTRPILILDEPFKFVSLDLMPLAGEMVRDISEKLGLQIVMVTHSEALIDCADRAFAVSQRDGISKIRRS